MAYVEERELSIHLVLRCAFPDDYDGDLDGYEWARELPSLTAELVRAVVTVVGRHPEWRARGGNRGRSIEDEVMLVLERKLGDSPPGGG